jgi:predicted glycosyltransferase
MQRMKWVVFTLPAVPIQQSYTVSACARLAQHINTPIVSFFSAPMLYLYAAQSACKGAGGAGHITMVQLDKRTCLPIVPAYQRDSGVSPILK